MESPTVERLAKLLLVLGERLELNAAPLAEAEGPVEELAASERLRDAASRYVSTR